MWVQTPPPVLESSNNSARESRVFLGRLQGCLHIFVAQGERVSDFSLVCVIPS